MPAPIAPAPMTATRASLGSAAVIDGVPEAELSASRELRRSLRGEGFYAFAIVVAVAERALHVALEVELRRERARSGRLQRFLDRRVAARRTLRQLREQLVGDALQLIVLDALPDETPRR